MKKGLLLAAGSILIITLAAGFFFYPQLKMEYGRAALFRVKHDSYYVLGPGSVEKNMMSRGILILLLPAINLMSRTPWK